MTRYQIMMRVSFTDNYELITDNFICRQSHLLSNDCTVPKLFLIDHRLIDELQSREADHVLLAVKSRKKEETVGVIHFGGKAPDEEGDHEAVYGKGGTEGEGVGFWLILHFVELLHMEHGESEEAVGDRLLCFLPHFLHGIQEDFIHGTFDFEKTYIEIQHFSCRFLGIAMGEKHAAKVFVR